MKLRLTILAAGAVAVMTTGSAFAEGLTFKTGAIRYNTHSKTNGISGIGIPAGADAQVGDASTVVFTIERALTPNVGVELVLGIPPTVKSRATGSVAFLGDNVLSAKNLAPTVFVNYHFGAPGDALRPYLGLGLNYTKFVSIQSKLAPSVQMSESMGMAWVGGVDYAINRQWGLYASASSLDVRSNVVGVASTVLTTSIDFRPVVYSVGASYKF
jgi:outer membrane protein